MTQIEIQTKPIRAAAILLLIQLLLVLSIAGKYLYERKTPPHLGSLIPIRSQHAPPRTLPRPSTNRKRLRPGPRSNPLHRRLQRPPRSRAESRLLDLDRITRNRKRPPHPKTRRPLHQPTRCSGTNPAHQPALQPNPTPLRSRILHPRHRQNPIPPKTRPATLGRSDHATQRPTPPHPTSHLQPSRLPTPPPRLKALAPEPGAPSSRQLHRR